MLVLLIPLFVSVFVLSYTFLYALKKHSKAYFICYQTGAMIQNQLGENLKSLLKLNPKVKKLRKQRKTAEIAYKKALLTGNPAVIKTAGVFLKITKAGQLRILVLQKSLLAKSSFLVQKRFRKLKKQSLNLMKNLKKRQEYSLAVKKHPPKADYPEYILRDSFFEKQKLKLIWKMDLLESVPSYLKRDFGKGGNFKYSCSVSLDPSDRVFSVRLAGEGMW